MILPIYYRVPLDWKDLQQKVAKIYQDIGYNTQIEVDIKLARGTVNVDVLCIKSTPLSNETIIIECKHWNKRIPKTVAHAFRSVIADHGANSGYIISKNGFQEGAYEAVVNTNIRLLTFEELQNAIRPIWLGVMIDKIEEVGYPLRKYCDPMQTFAANNYDLLPAEKQEQIDKLMRKYYPIALHTFRGLYKDVMSGRLELEYIDEQILNNIKDFPGTKVNSLMEYFELIYETCVSVVSDFDKLYGQKLRKR